MPYVVFECSTTHLLHANMDAVAEPVAADVFGDLSANE